MIVVFFITAFLFHRKSKFRFDLVTTVVRIFIFSLKKSHFQVSNPVVYDYRAETKKKHDLLHAILVTSPLLGRY